MEENPTGVVLDRLALVGNQILPCSDPDAFYAMARVQEFQDEGNNVTAEPMPIVMAPPPDLQVTSVVVPEHVIAGQEFDLSYTVTNTGPGDTPPRQDKWDDLIYLSRDPFLDLRADLFVGSEEHKKGLVAGASYQVDRTLEVPYGAVGPFYVIVITDPVRSASTAPWGNVFELDAERNNDTPSPQPMIIELPPPADLQVASIAVPSQGQIGHATEISWTVTNFDHSIESGTWTDAVYLSEDAVWDIDDPLIGRAGYTTRRVDDDGVPYDEVLKLDDSYTLTVNALLPPAKPGQYRIIVRPDIFNQVYEAENEANNRTASGDTISVTVDQLHVGVPLDTTLSTGLQQLYQVTVGQGETLRVTVTSDADDAVNELFLRFDDVPTSTVYDATYEGFLGPDQMAVVPSTEAGTYYVLLRGYSAPYGGASVTLLAELLPLSIFDVVPDVGGDGRWVTTTILGAQFHEDAIAKMVRPGFAEFEPISYEVVNSTKIIAIFDLRDAPHGLYDVKVINPDGEEAIVPYRYLVERAMEPDVTIGMGGPRVLRPGATGTYSVSVHNFTNVDTPYTFFEFGLPELGLNPEVFNFKYVAFTSNLRGSPETADLADVPWASLDSAVNTPRARSWPPAMYSTSPLRDM